MMTNLLSSSVARLRFLLVMFLTLSVSANVWGAEATINANQITGFGNGSSYTSSSITIDDITIASNSGFSTTQFRVAKSKNLVISCAGKMTKIVFTVSSTNYKLNATGINWSSTTGTYTNASGIESVTFSNSNANIARITKIVVTYTPSSSGGNPDPCTAPTIEWNTKPANGEVGGSMTASITTNYSDGLTYSSSNQTVAAVTNAGVINYLAAGTTTITATVTGDGTTICEGPVSVQQEITVTAPAGGGGSDDCDNPTWQLVTDVSDLAVGDEIVIAASGEDYALSITQNNNNRSATAITKSNNTITFNEAVQIITLAQGSTTGTLSFFVGSGYLYAASSSKNYMRTSLIPGSDGDWVIGIDNNTGVATIQAQGDNTNSVIRYNPNSGTPIFSCYASTSIVGSLPAIYKKVCGSTELTYSVTYNTNGATSGSVPVDNTTYAKDAQVTVLGNTGTLAKTGYTFSGWNTEANGTGTTTYAEGDKFTITKNTTLYAKWTAIQTTITLNANGGSGNTPSVAATYDSSTLNPSSITNPTKTGHTFGGWYSGAGGTGSLVINSSGKLQANVSGFTGTNGVWKATTNKNLYAKWTPAVYTINYKDQGDVAFSGTHEEEYPQTHTYNTETTLKSASKEHYTFGGWYKENDCSGTEVTTLGATEYTDEITLYAKWTANTYTITFNAGTGECVTGPANTTNASGVTLPTSNPPAACATDDWEFAGWWTESVAETTTSPGELLTAGSNYKPTSNCTLYAVYSYTEAGGGDSDVTFNFSDIATANSWTNGTAYTTVTISPITINAIGGGNNGKYYTSNTSWRMYNGGSLQISTGIGKITSVSSNPSKTFTINDEGTATLSFSATTEFKSITVSYSSTTYNSNPVCIPTYSITYDFVGGTGSHCSNTSVQQGNPYTICDEAPTKEGHTFQGWSDGTSTYDGGATFTPTGDVTLTAVWKANTYTVTWNNNGDTDEETYNHGDALVVPTAPASCDGVKEFVGWTEQSGYYHATTAPTDLFKTTTATVTADKTYYAVFATPPGTSGGGGGSETTIDDVLTRETTGVTNESTTYASWSGKTAESSAVYAGNSAGDNDAIQLRSNNNNSGIVTTTSGGKVTRVEVDWESNTASDRTLDIYGRNVAYSAATDLYNASTQGTKLGSIVYGTSTELEITGDYEYIGLRSKSGAMYLTSVTITWSSAGGSSSYTDYTTICQEVTGIAISGSYPTAFVQYDSFSFAGGIVTATFENGSTQDVTSLATFSGYNMDEVGVQTVTVTYMGQTAKYEITINQSDRWRLTWNVSGKTNTGARPIYVQKGSAIGTLPVPEVPAACAGKTFMGWTESNIVPSDGKGIVYITEGTVPSKNTTYYAVFATINNFSVQKPIEDIESGSNVVIVAVASLTDDGGSGKAISSRATDDTYNLQGDSVAIYDQTINTPHSTCIWKITKSGEKYIFTQDGKYLNAIYDDGHYNLRYSNTQDTWTITDVDGMVNTYRMQSTVTNYFAEFFKGKFTLYYEANDKGDFDMQFYVTANANGEADITDYTTGCAEYTITYYGFHGGYSTSCSSDGTIVLPVNSIHTIPDCEGLVINDHTNLGREFLNVWMTQPHGGHTFKPGDTFILTQDTTLYAQWKMETTSDVTTLPTDIEDLAGTDIYVYGGKTLNIQPGTTTINSLTLKGGLQADGSYKMPTVWVPEGATLVRNSNKIYLDLKVNAKNYYPFAVPFRAKNGSAKANWDYVGYINPVLKEAATYRTHFVIKTYDGAKRADKGENRDANWAIVNRDTYLEPGVGYMITAMTYAGTDTVTIRIPMSVSNTWFKNGEQAEVGTTVRNTIAVTAHAGEAATEHQRHAGWNFVANPYLTSFTGGNVANDDGLAYINGELIIEGSYEYGGEDVPYVTIPAYNFAYYSQHKLSDVKLSPEWSFFVQVGTGGTMNFTTAGRQQAPAHLAARAAEQPIKMDVDITLSDDNHSDQTGLIICDRFSDAYEIGHDLEKMFGSAYNLSVYTLMADNTPLAFQALAIQNSMQVIPVGYRTPAQGEYTFALNEATSDIELLNEQYEQLILVDYETGALTNMLNNEYTFYSDRTQSNNRFALYAVLRQNTTTDLPNTIGNEEVKKVIYNDHFYILRNGKVFNGAGQIVK